MKQKCKKRQLKRIIILSVLALCAMSSFGILSASANNYTDLEKEYDVGGYSYKWTDVARKKEDDSSSYQKCLSATTTYQSWVYGSNSETITNDISNIHNGTIKYQLKDPRNGNSTPAYTFKTGTTYYMINYVHENNLKNAGMILWTGGPTGGKTKIRWSPDSI